MSKDSASRFDAREVLAVIALAIFGGSLWMDHLGYLADWAKGPIGAIPTTVLGYYFVDSFRRGQGSGAPVAPPSVEPKPPAPPAE